MGLTSQQPHVEFWNTECYGPKVYVDVPGNDKQAFAMVTTLFAARSRGEVTLMSADPTQNPIVDHKYLTDPLDLLVLSEGCRLANEIAVEGTGTKDFITGSWPSHLTHHTHKHRAQWASFVKRNADTCEREIYLLPIPCSPLVLLSQLTDITQAIIPPVLARWEQTTTRWLYLIHSCGFEELKGFGS